MLISKELEVKWHPKNTDYYISKGYIFTKYGDTFIVKFEDVLHNGMQRVLLKCDYQQEGN